MTDKEPTSFLGTSPTCDICGKYIAVDDCVRQEFVGPVVAENGELGIAETHYTLVHISCERRYQS